MTEVEKMYERIKAICEGKYFDFSKIETIDCFSGEYEFLSNFYPCEITMPDGIVYPTSEHAFQAQKTQDIDKRRNIATLSTPGQAKRAGRKLELRKDWEDIKNDVMFTTILYKFQNPELKGKLLATQGKMLVEGNTWHDNYWGNCTCDRCKNIKGENHLGQSLMGLRIFLLLLEDMCSD